MSDNGNGKGALTPIAWVLIALFVGIGGYIIGSYVGKGKEEKIEKVEKADKKTEKKEKEKKPEPKEDADKMVFNMPLGNSPVKGAKDDALVTIIVCSDFQCPFCGRVNPTIDKLIEENPGKIRASFKHFPLGFHQQALPAAKASIAAEKQGKFWEMHDLLFANQRELSQDKFIAFAQQLGLDVEKFKKDMEDPEAEKITKADEALCQSRGVRGTPGIFLNGRFIRGALPYEHFKRILDEELPKAQELAEKLGAKGDKLYNEIIKSGRTSPAPEPERERQEPPAEWVKVEVGKNTPRLGPEYAPVTIVEFSDFECPFCSRASKTVHEIHEKYGDKVRIFFRQLPLSFHKNAHLAAQASLAAHAQGKFWQYHDKLFENQRALQKENLIQFAKDVGLDVKRFTAELDSGKYKDAVDEEIKYSTQVGARGTPHFFINGKRFSGARPFEQFKVEIDAALAKAEEELKKGTTLDKLYDNLMANLPKSAPTPPRPAEVDDPNKVYDVKVGAAPSKGPANAPITIIEFSEFQCPFCKRAAPTIEQILKDYKGQVRIAFKHNPLPFHNNAMNASLAAMAAAEQGKFWEMHDILFENQQALDPSQYESYAQKAGLDVAKWKKAYESQKYKAHIEADQKEAMTVGAQGTPTFFINGRKLVGAQPYENFKRMIDEELAKKKK
ncbi:MAG: hypothetical protein Kow0090_14490 [Myxococcota bacterium]